MAKKSKRKRGAATARQRLSPAAQRQFVEAEAAYARGELAHARLQLERILEGAPGYVPAMLALAQIARDELRTSDAIEYLQVVAKLTPDNGQAIAELGRLLVQRNDLAQGMDMFRRAYRLGDRSGALMSTMPAALLSMGQHSAGIKLALESARTHPEDHRLHSSRLLALNYTTDHTAAGIVSAHRAWGVQCTDSVEARAPNNSGAFAPGVSPERLRLGIVSSDLRQHSVSHFLTPLLANLNRERFEIIVYHTHPNRDATTVRLMPTVDQWHNVADLPDAELLRCIQADGIHILMDLNGHTAYNRLPVFAARAAPVQLTYLGYPNTTGLEAMDFRIVDDITDPPNGAETADNARGTETLLRLPGPFLCYAPAPDAPELSSAEQGGPLTFGCFNNSQKLTDEVLATWVEILRAVQRSRLLLKSKVAGDRAYAARVTRYFTERGISQKRLDLRPYAPSPREGLAEYRHVDIALDTFPYNGTTTTCEAMWMGVPVITLQGDRHAGRVGASLLHAVGLAELVATSSADYVRAAVALANETERRILLSRELRDRMKESALMDAPYFARKFEALLEDAWQRKSSTTASSGP